MSNSNETKKVPELNVSEFKRGWVVRVNFPTTASNSLTPGNSFIMNGEHFAIVLHDYDLSDIDSRLVLVVPITTAEAEENKARRQKRPMLASYVPILQEEHPFLDHKSYISTGQVVPLNRDWIIKYCGTIQEATMFEVDFQMIYNLGLTKTIQQLAEDKYKELLNEEADNA